MTVSGSSFEASEEAEECELLGLLELGAVVDFPPHKERKGTRVHDQRLLGGLEPDAPPSSCFIARPSTPYVSSAEIAADST